jgi:hypothetical protein
LVNINDARRSSRMQDERSKEQHMRWWSTTRRVGSLRIENYGGGGGEYEE